MKLLDILSEPTVYNNVHESIYRSWHILNAVEWLLERNTPPEVVLSIVRELRAHEAAGPIPEPYDVDGHTPDVSGTGE